jgi:hypothetical protein
MPGLVPGIHVLLYVMREINRTWIGGTIGERSDAVLRTSMGERSDAVLRTSIGERSAAVLRTSMPGHDGDE